MRLLIRQAFVGGALVLLCSRPVIAADADPCAKEILVYVDISDTMNRTVSGKRALTDFSQAVGGLINSKDFVGPNDTVRVMLFGDTVREIATATSTPAEAALVLDRLSTIENYKELVGTNKLDRYRTNFSAVMKHIDERLKDDAPRFVVLASDFLHDPDNSEGELSGSRGDARARTLARWKAQVSDVAAQVAGYPLSTDASSVRVIPLLPASTTDDALSLLSFSLLRAFEKKFDCKGHVVTGFRADVGDIKKALARAPEFETDKTKIRTATGVPLRAHNRNPFTIEWVRVRAMIGKKEVASDDRVISIPCGSPGVRDFSLPSEIDAGEVTIEAFFNPSANPNPIKIAVGTLDITNLEVHPFREYIGPGTLVLNARIRNNRSKATKLYVKVGATAYREFEIKASDRDKQFIFTVEPLADDVPLFDEQGRVPVQIWLGKNEGVLTQDGIPTSGQLSATTPKTWLHNVKTIYEAASYPAGVVFLLMALWRILRGRGTVASWLTILLTVLYLFAMSFNLTMTDSSLFAPPTTSGVLGWLSARYLWCWGLLWGGFTFFLSRFLLTACWSLIERELLEHRRAALWRRCFMVILVAATVYSGVVLPLQLNALMKDGAVRPPTSTKP